MKKFFLPRETINPLTGLTREQEVKIQAAIGGSLPFDAYESMIKRGVIPYPDKKITPFKAASKKKSKHRGILA